MKKTGIWIGVAGCSILLELFFGYGNHSIFAEQMQDRYFWKTEQVTGSAATITDSAIVTKETIFAETEHPEISEHPMNTQENLMPQTEENFQTFASEMQETTEIDANLKKNRLKLGMGEQVKMPVQNDSGLSVTYQSKNKRVASVSRKGIIRGKKKGITEIYAKISTKTLVLKTQVKKKPTSIKIKVPKRSSVNIGTKIALKVSLNKGSASYKIRWSSSKKSVATVNPSGVLLVRGRGRTTITAKTYNGKKAKIVFAFH